MDASVGSLILIALGVVGLIVFLIVFFVVISFVNIWIPGRERRCSTPISFPWEITGTQQ